jgi:hypothetical protein
MGIWHWGNGKAHVLSWLARKMMRMGKFLCKTKIGNCPDSQAIGSRDRKNGRFERLFFLLRWCYVVLHENA